jgi:phosphopantetheinyl transferase
MFDVLTNMPCASISLAKLDDGGLHIRGVDECSSWKQFKQLLYIRLRCAVEIEPLSNWRTCFTNDATMPPNNLMTGGIRHPQRQVSRLAGRAAAKRAAKVWLKDDQTANLEVSNLPSGKPQFIFYPDLHLSISHSGDLAAASVSSEPHGIDLELVESRPASLTRYFFSSAEQRWIENSTNPLTALHVLWTRKEAVSKLLGKGGQLGFRNLSVLDGDTSWNFLSYTIGNYVCSLAHFSGEGAK